MVAKSKKLGAIFFKKKQEISEKYIENALKMRYVFQPVGNAFQQAAIILNALAMFPNALQCLAMH